MYLASGLQSRHGAGVLNPAGSSPFLPSLIASLLVVQPMNDERYRPMFVFRNPLLQSIFDRFTPTVRQKTLTSGKCTALANLVTQRFLLTVRVPFACLQPSSCRSATRAACSASSLRAATPTCCSCAPRAPAAVSEWLLPLLLSTLPCLLLSLCCFAWRRLTFALLACLR